MPYEEAVDMLKKSIKKMYGKKAIRLQSFFFKAANMAPIFVVL